MPDIPRAALIHSETRPRCDRYEDGLILNLRRVNLNADQSVDDMLSVRLGVTEALVVSVRAAVAEAPPDRAFCHLDFGKDLDTILTCKNREFP